MSPRERAALLDAAEWLEQAAHVERASNTTSDGKWNDREAHAQFNSYCRSVKQLRRIVAKYRAQAYAR